jgi:hypothetical protein
MRNYTITVPVTFTMDISEEDATSTHDAMLFVEYLMAEDKLEFGNQWCCHGDIKVTLTE